MSLTGPDAALLLERAEALHLQRQVAGYRRLSGLPEVRTVAIFGGLAAFTETPFGRKLNHVTALGMGAPVTDDGLAQLEDAYAALGLGVEIDLCPHAHASVLTALTRRGYGVNAFSNTYVRRLDDSIVDAVTPDGIVVAGDSARVRDAFVTASVAGFAVQAVTRPTRLLEALAQIAVGRDDTSLYAATVHGETAGTAGMSVLEIDGIKIAHLYIASTLPAFRGRGVQSALLRARLADARRAGCTLATVAARPANTSARNAERAGFQLAYTKATFAKPLP